MVDDFTKCCGCRACEQICSSKAITMSFDEYGFLRPEVNNEKCVKCGLCINACDFNNLHQEFYAQPIKGFAGISIDKNVLESSSSGGAFASICKAIDSNAVIYGCAFENKLVVTQIRTEGITEIHELQKSKYVQSNTKDTFKRVKTDLNDKKNVIYSGTPCQIAGLRAYLGKDYDNLYTIGLICHGVPSQKFFDNYIHYMEGRYKIEITQYSFRNRHTLFNDTEIGIKFGNARKSKHLAWGQDYFMNLYLKGLCYRKECYECPYANADIYRPEDITIGDCWNIDRFIPAIDAANGVSTIIFNTNKAMRLVEKLKEHMELYNVDISILSANNPNLTHPTKKHSEREIIYDLQKNNTPFDKIASAYIKRLGYPHHVKVLFYLLRKWIRRKK